MSDVGVVVIGRNEGERLRASLTAALRHVSRIVYVDSGSTDGSVELARSLGAEAISLDSSRPFSAARGRNEGFARLMEIDPACEFVQFIDGDCLLVDTWIDVGVAALRADPKIAVVCGRRREENAQGSIYNLLCDIEWNKPTGKSDACEGDAMMRTAVFAAMGGFDSTLIAGEEPELCLRMRQAGWEILRVPNDMTMHDVAMTRFSQWWKRAVRAGHAYAEGAAMHGRAHYFTRSAGICFFGALVPLAAIALAWPSRGLSVLFAVLLYGVLAQRAFTGTRKQAGNTRDAILNAFFIVLGKFPMFEGHVHYWYRSLTGRHVGPIEYKNAGAQTGIVNEPLRPAEAVN